MGSGKCPSFNRTLAQKREPVAAKGKSGLEKMQDTYMTECGEGRKNDDVSLRELVGDFL